MAIKRNHEVSPKKLRPKACVEFLKRWHRYSRGVGHNREDIRTRQMRTLFISQAYLNELLRKCDSLFNLCISFTGHRIYSVYFTGLATKFPECSKNDGQVYF
jgi:hypothetical protein